jgi:hypothetical protein
LIQIFIFVLSNFDDAPNGLKGFFRHPASGTLLFDHERRGGFVGKDSRHRLVAKKDIE